MTARRLRGSVLALAGFFLAAGGPGPGWTSAAQADSPADAVTITDVASWQHPTKKIFEKYKIKLVKIDLLQDKKYPVFHVAGGPDPMLGHNDAFYTPLLVDLLKANANWPYEMQFDEDKIGYKVKWDKQHKSIRIEPSDFD